MPPDDMPTPIPCQVSAWSWSRSRTTLAGLGLLFLSLASGPAGAADLPPDVAAFVARRNRCDHLRGEDSEDAAQRAAIAQALTADCRGTDAELARLRHRHVGHNAVRDRLSGYDPDVEGLSPRRR